MSKFSYKEKGALLLVIGDLMMDRELCAGAAADADFSNYHAENLKLELPGISDERVKEILAMPLEEAISLTE